MTTAIAVKAPPVEWARELDGAKMLLRSGLLPDTIKTAEAALFIILTGRDLGLSPIQSLRSINIIKGKVELAADAQLGLFHRAGGKSHWVTLTEDAAVLRLVAPWLLSPHDEHFTMEDAKRAGLAASQNYKAYPKAMLRSRAITAGLKSVGFDPTAGVYDYGEIGGPEQPFMAEAVEVEEGDAAEPLVAMTAQPVDERPLTKAERQELLAEAAQAGIDTADDWRGFIETTLGRELKSEKDITYPSDVTALIAALRQRAK